MDKTFTFNNQDDTVGNIVRHKLLQDSRVSFAAYRTPHPLTRSVEIRVQTLKDDPVDVLQEAINKLLVEVDNFQDAFTTATSE